MKTQSPAAAVRLARTPLLPRAARTPRPAATPLPGENGAATDPLLSPSPQPVCDCSAPAWPGDAGGPPPLQALRPPEVRPPASGAHLNKLESLSPQQTQTGSQRTRSGSHLYGRLPLPPPVCRQPTAALCASPGTGPQVLVTLQTLPNQAPSLSPSPSPHVRRRLPKGTTDPSCECPGHSDPTAHLATCGWLPGLSSEAPDVQHAHTTDRRGCPS